MDIKSITQDTNVAAGAPKGSPDQDGLRLLLNWAARHGDNELAPAAANILARIDGGNKPDFDPMDISAPAHKVQQHVGLNQFLGVEVSPEELEKAPIDDTKAVPQVGGIDPVGQTLKKDSAKTPEQVSVQATSLSTAVPLSSPTDKK